MAAIAASLLIVVGINWANGNNDNDRSGVVAATPEEAPTTIEPRDEDLATRVSDATTVLALRRSNPLSTGSSEDLVDIQVATDEEQHSLLLETLQWRVREPVDLNNQIVVALTKPGSPNGPGPT